MDPAGPNPIQDVAHALTRCCPVVRQAMEDWPVDLLARCNELLDLLKDHGPQLRLPHAKAMGDGLFELRPKSRSGIWTSFLLLLQRVSHHYPPCFRQEDTKDPQKRACKSSHAP